MQIRIQMEHTGVSHTLLAGPADIVALELRFGISFEDVEIPGKRRMTHIYFLGWSAASRAGITTDPFEKWIEGLSDLETSPVDVVPLDEILSSG